MPDKPETLEEISKGYQVDYIARYGVEIAGNVARDCEAFRRSFIALCHEFGLLPNRESVKEVARLVEETFGDPTTSAAHLPIDNAVRKVQPILPDSEEAKEKMREFVAALQREFPTATVVSSGNCAILTETADPTTSAHTCATSTLKEGENSRICDKLYTEQSVLDAMRWAAEAMRTACLAEVSDMVDANDVAKIPLPDLFAILSACPSLSRDNDPGLLPLDSELAQRVANAETKNQEIAEQVEKLTAQAKALIAVNTQLQQERDGLKAACATWEKNYNELHERLIQLQCTLNGV